MPKRPSVPSYRLHRASGLAIVTLNGRMTYLGKFDSPESREKYDRLLAEWLSRNRTPLPAANQQNGTGGGITVVEIVAGFWVHAERHYRKNGELTGEMAPLKSVLRLLKETYGSTPAAEFGPLRLDALRQRMIQKGWARSTINGQVSRVIRLFRWAAGRELIPASVPAALRELSPLLEGRTAAKETPPVLPVCDADFTATLPHLPRTVADLLRVQRLTGSRPNEICSLRPADIDRTGEIWQFSPRSHKSQHRGKARIISIGPQAQKILLPYLENRDGDSFCFQPGESQARQRQARSAARKTPLSCGNKPGAHTTENPKRTPGRTYSASSIAVAVRRACKLANVKPWSANQLRHTFATAVRDKFGLEFVQVACGHSHASTSEIYAEPDVSKAAAVALALG